MAERKREPSRRRDAAEVLPASPAIVNPDEQLAASEGTTIVEWLRGLGPFFATATRLEVEAVQGLAAARQLQAPTTGDEDAAIQAFTKARREHKRGVETHWKITAIVYGFQRRLAAARDRAATADDQAATIAQNHHNTYVENERRRAAAETERLRREAEARAQAERDREAAAAEAAALKREAESPTLSEREAMFVDLIVQGVVASQAAHRAGYKDTTRGLKMIEQPKIAQAIQAKRDAAAIRIQAAARKAEPLHVDVEEVRPDVQRASGSYDRGTWTGEVLDEPKLMAAFLAGGHGIPADIWTVNPTKLNEYARSLQKRLDLWPGVRSKHKVTTV